MMDAEALVCVVDDDAPMRASLQNLLRSVGLRVEAFASAQEFLRSTRPEVPSCLVLDVRLPGLSVHHPPSSCPRGTVNCMTAPRGTLAVAHSRPPCASIIRRLIANPRPRPCGLVV